MPDQMPKDLNFGDNAIEKINRNVAIAWKIIKWKSNMNATDDIVVAVKNAQAGLGMGEENTLALKPKDKDWKNEIKD